jgi:hypothetical protein
MDEKGRCSMIYVVIDTSILVRTWTQAKAGCEIENLAELSALAAKNAIRVLFGFCCPKWSS